MSIPIWRVSAPTQAAMAPEWMSFHMLLEVEKCPLASTLKRSTYAQLWDGVGYPSKPSISAAVGSIVHSAAQHLMRELMRDGVASNRDEASIDTLRRLGGLSTVLNKESTAFIERERLNPRFQSFAPAFERSLAMKLPRMRELLQELLSEQKWVVRPIAATTKPQAPSSSRSRLRDGTSFEVEVRNPAIRWKGRIDAITLDHGLCSISDLKTGEPSDSHIEQLKTYSVLWHGDKEINPDGIPIAALTIYYGSSPVSVKPLTLEEVATLRASIVDRTTRAEQDLALSPTPARPSESNCLFCQVKLLCPEYWKTRQIDSPENFQDLELALISKRNDFVWIARETRNGIAGRELLLTRPNGGAPYWEDLAPGLHLRLTDAHVTAREQDFPLAVPTTFSEALVV